MRRKEGGVGRGRAEPRAIDDANFHPLFSFSLSLVCWRRAALRGRGAHSLYSASYLGHGPYSILRPHFPLVQSLLLLKVRTNERGFELEAVTSSLVKLFHYLCAAAPLLAGPGSTEPLKSGRPDPEANQLDRCANATGTQGLLSG